jgi:hypothetical protein
MCSGRIKIINLFHLNFRKYRVISFQPANVLCENICLGVLIICNGSAHTIKRLNKRGLANRGDERNEENEKNERNYNRVFAGVKPSGIHIDEESGMALFPPKAFPLDNFVQAKCGAGLCRRSPACRNLV